MTVSPVNTAPEVLIADDDAPLRAAVRLALEVRGYRCAEAADGWQAVDLARSVRPQCVFVDIAMPGLDGFAVVQRLRSDPHTSGMHIHCLTGLADPDVCSRALSAGFEEFLTKPVPPSRMLEIVQRHVRRSSWVAGLTKTEAEGLMDWLAYHGCTDLEVSCSAVEGFAVRCLPPQGIQLIQQPGGDIRLMPR
jgi:CheY-like chemotaxis protein